MIPAQALAWVHAASTWALVGLIWTIQLVHYPLFARVGAEHFVEYEREHGARITWLVAPLMAVDAHQAERETPPAARRRLTTSTGRVPSTR